MYLHYQDVEKLVFTTVDTETHWTLNQLQGRIRNLRRKCVPNLPRPGTGRQIVYSASNIRYLALALRLNLAGVKPELIKDIASNTLVLDFTKGERLLNTEYLIIYCKSGPKLIRVLFTNNANINLTSSDHSAFAISLKGIFKCAQLQNSS